MSEKRTIKVGKEIFNILSESLYSNPIHLFREYVQNSIDSISRRSINYQGTIKIIVLKADGTIEDDLENINLSSEYHLLFVDDGQGYNGNIDDMITDMAISGKNEREFIGYKGIGRFSGFSFCDTITFINNKSGVDKITVDANAIRESSNDEEFFIDDYIIDPRNERLYNKYIKENKFLVLLSNLSRKLKVMIKNPDFILRLANQLKCKYDILTYNVEVNKFLSEKNMSINYKLFLNDKEIRRMYCTKKNMEQDAIISIMPDVDETRNSFEYFGETLEEGEVLAKAIIKIGHKINYTYRKANNLPFGVKIYHKGMLVTEGEDIISKIHSIYPFRKTAGEFASTIRSFYVEVHIESRDILLNSARDWVSFIVNSEYRENRATLFVLGMHSLVNRLDSLRYDFSKYYVETRKNNDKSKKVERLKSKLEDNLNSMSSNISINANMIDNYIQKEKSSTIVIRSVDYDDFILNPNAVFKINNCRKVEEFIYELKNLRISIFKNACCITFRSFIEMSLKYLAKIEEEYSFIQSNLTASLIKANNLFFGASSNKDIQLIHKSINRQIKSEECMYFLNGAVHNIEYIVNAVELKAIRDTLFPLIMKIYS